MFRSTLIATAFALVALAGTAAAASPPGFSSGGGCSIQCIQKAWVTSTASSASVEVKTSVPTTVQVSAAEVGTKPSQFAAPAVKAHNPVPGFAKERTVVLAGLRPETTYRIVVSATDAQGKTETQIGTFKTRKVETAIGGVPNGFDSGLGCSAGCIQKALFTQLKSAPRSAQVKVKTAIAAEIEIVVRLGLTTIDVKKSSGPKTSWTTTVSGLMPASTYSVTVRAKDASGHVDQRAGTFRTVDAVAYVMISKIQVIADGDKGRNKGELSFDYWVNGQTKGSSWRKIGSGDVIGAPVGGQSRPGASFAVSVGPNAVLDLRVGGYECDAAVLANCVVGPNPSQAVPSGDVPPPSGGGHCGYKTQCAWAVGIFSLASVLDQSGALPANYGMYLPAGQDGYMVFATTAHYVKFRVFAYVNVHHLFPE